MRAMKSLLRGLLRPSQKTQFKSNQMSEVKKKTKIYQWIKGDNLGQVSRVAESQPDNKWLWFEDGKRINPSLIKEYLMEIADEESALKLDPVRGGNSEVQTMSIVTETKESSKSNNTPDKELSIMGKMIEKMSKKNLVQIPININVSIPTPAIYEMLAEGMEKEDLDEEIIQAALSQLEINKLQEFIKDNITNFLNDYYGK